MIPVSEPSIGDAELEYVREAIESGWVSPRGDYVREFEDGFSDIVGTDYAFATSSGTAALHLSLVACDIGPGDEVIVPDLTWIACANVVEYVGAEPVFADVDPETLTLDPESVEDVLSPQTAAIMPVHLYGHPCDMDAVQAIANREDLLVVEDAAEAHGAEFKGQQVGSIGDIGCFSFYGNKILTTGQGGIITTDCREIAEEVRLYRRDGMSTERKYHHPVIGYNYRLTNLQAAFGVGQLERFDEILEQKRQNAVRYQENLADTGLDHSIEREWATSVYWMFNVFPSDVETRNQIQTALSEADIETRPLFEPLNQQSPYVDAIAADCDASEVASNLGLTLPSGAPLTGDEIDRICKIVADQLD
ncbi:aminotransferase class I/II-fold pyridoxal phosphate-dependent enzyme [Halomicrobium mukohataei]|uniref:Aminotransferase class I/II-fold pyridoxal phosphate-dependent enzyme n=1 Tax=Halomicrobium mukohataei TaxID=57705 RepID=A0A847TQR7_9EURY|nr:DegT/DnrJ/EryC1/StrS family aminotransferase [Halomicrobium mukohataei]NLV08382.1 aminotransferase class I/II-fold pyridoxal phosphate-dependent enzyme [Halomicrobium mukohataei]